MNRRAFLASCMLSAISVYANDKKVQVDLKILNFDDYFAEDTIKNFELLTGKKVYLDTYGSESEAVSKFLASNPRYDLMFISDINVERFIRLGGLLSKIDKSEIPNISNIQKSFLTAEFDPGRSYSLPYFWGTLGIGYRKSAFSKKPDSLKYLLDSDKYKGRIALLADGTTNIQMALKYLGFSLNTTNKDEIDKAAALLKKQAPHIKYFAADNGQDLLKNGDVDIVLEWNGDMLQLIDESDEFGFVVPKEGTLLWEDCIVFPMRSKNKNLAQEFANYLYEEKTGVSLAQYLQYATPNERVKQLMDKTYLENEAIFPSKESLAKCEKIKYNGAEVKSWHDRAWANILGKEER
jgi:spermidine/putrescine transport system substrate-binding protein